MAFDLEAALQRALAATAAPTKRQVRTASGRAERRAANGQKVLQAVGGRASWVQASLAPDGTELCRVVPMATGWNADGTPKRPTIAEYRPGPKSVAARCAL